jgi:hypothetical protein
MVDGQGGGIGGELIKRLKEATRRSMRSSPWEPTRWPLPHLVNRLITGKLKEFLKNV